MTAPNDPHQTPTTTSARLRPALEPDLSPETPQGTRETTSAPAPLYEVGGRSQRALPGRTHDLGPNTGPNWLITPRTKPFWTALLELLSDGSWHPQEDAIAIGLGHGLAKRTVQNLLPKAGKRKWTRRHHGLIALRDRHAFEAALMVASS